VIPEDRLEENHFEFLHAVWTRRTSFTFFFLGVNIAVFVLMSLAGGTTNETTLMAFGVKSNAQIDQGEIWRFVTPVFIHIGLLHLFFNSYALWIVGPQVEKLYGGARFVLLYLVTGVAGVAGSYFYHPEIVSAGASGAIFGLFGVLLVFGIRYRHSIPPFFKRAVGTGVLPVILINLIIGFTIPGIDNSAHIAGLLAGAALAAVLPFQRPGEETPSIYTAFQFVLLAIVAVSFFEVARHYDGPRLSVRNLSRGFTQILGTSSSIQDFIDTINNAQKTFDTSARQLESGSIDGLAQVRTNVTKSIDELRRIPSLAARPDELAAQLRQVMQDQYELIQDVERAGTVTLAHSRRLKENASRYEEVMATFLKWVETDGPKYGIQTGKRR
jgi:membrane associated rhomboid family serine protease